MATKNFSQMTTKKLSALIETASQEDKLAIQEILDSRAQAKQKEQVYINPDCPPTPEDEAAWAAEEAAAAEPKKEKARMTDEERIAFAAALREKFINHKCEVVPFNTAEWVDGVVTGVVEDKRSNKVLFAVKLDDGRRVVKVHDSNLIKISDEVVERVATRRVYTNREKVEKTPWTSEQMEADVMAVAVNVGKMVTYKEGEAEIEGRIISIVPDKRSQRCLYRIEIPIDTEDGKAAVKYAHKVSTLTTLSIAEDFDEIGKEINEKFIARRANAINKEPITPESRVLKAEEAFKKAEETLRKAQETYDIRKAALESAKKEYEAYLSSQNAGCNTNEEPLA